MKDERKSGAELSRDTLLRAMDDAADNDAKTIHFSGGGEPLMHPDIKQAIAMAKYKGLKVALSTNGINLTEEIASMVDYPRISLDAVNADMYKIVKGSDNFQKIIDSIGSLSEESKEKLGLGMILNKYNYESIYEFCQIGYYLGVGFVHIRPEFTRDNTDNKMLQIYQTYFEKMVDLAKDVFGHKLEIYLSMEKFDGYWTPRCYNKCRATPLIAALKANGKFIPCQDRLDLEFGDYNKQTFLQVWYGTEHDKALKSIRLDDCPRCVETKKNEYIQKLFIEDGFLRDML